MSPWHIDACPCTQAAAFQRAEALAAKRYQDTLALFLRETLDSNQEEAEAMAKDAWAARAVPSEPAEGD